MVTGGVRLSVLIAVDDSRRPDKTEPLTARKYKRSRPIINHAVVALAPPRGACQRLLRQ